MPSPSRQPEPARPAPEEEAAALLEDVKPLPGAEAEARPCQALDVLPDHMKPEYRVLALITHQGQVDILKPGDTDTLIVCCDWLIWQGLIARGRHAVYYELGITDWSEPDDLDTDLFLRATDPVYDGGADQTVFRGVSLGKAFAGEISMALMNFHRLNRSMRKLIERFRPEEIHYFDFRYDINVLDNALRKNFAKHIASEYGLVFIDRSREGGDSPPPIAERLFVTPKPNPFKDVLRYFYTRGLEATSNLRCLFKDRDRRVMVLLIANQVEPLVRNFPGGALTPMFLGSTIPKKPALLFRCLARGILLVTPRPVRLTAADRRRVEEIRAAMEKILEHSAAEGIEVLRPYIRDRILNTDRLEERAALVLSVERLFDRYGPTRVVVDGVRNSPPRVYVELARMRGMEVDYIWHAPWTPQSIKFDALGGDPRSAPAVTRCLSWGATNDVWLDRVGATQPRVRTGSPIADRYRGTNGGGSDRKAPTDSNVLLLHYTFTVSDIRGLNANMYAIFVNAVRKLRALGYRNIRFKMHPGPGRWTKDYFGRIGRYFGLDCEILKLEPFDECLDWADFVIGPMQTGAMFEALAAGKTYHALLIPPTSHDPSYYPGYPYCASVEELAAAFKGPPPASARAVLNGIYGIDEFPSTSRRFWEVMAGDSKTLRGTP